MRGQTAELKLSTKILNFKRNYRFNGESKYSGTKQRLKVALQAFYTHSVFYESLVLVTTLISLVFVMINFSNEGQQFFDKGILVSSIITIGVTSLASMMIIKKYRIGKKLEVLSIKENIGEIN